MRTKEQVLALLETRRGESVSGEAIADKLGLSRNAVWKAIQALRADGHGITAVPNRGYCLSEGDDVLSAAGILAHLTQALDVHIYPSVASTNETAKELAIAGAKHGTIIAAEQQSAGKGRYGRGFHSPAGQIYMSLILRPAKLWLNTPTLITAFAAVAVCEAIETLCHKQPKIKWVNDIFLGQKKLCGILTEAVTDFESGQIGWIVVGIGINFTAEFPGELADIAASLFTGEPPAVTRNRLIAEVVNRMLSMGEQRGEQALLEAYKQRLMMLGKQVLVTGSGEDYTATAFDIDETGRLLVRRATGEVQALSSGEVSIVNLN